MIPGQLSHLLRKRLRGSGNGHYLVPADLAEADELDDVAGEDVREHREL